MKFIQQMKTILEGFNAVALAGAAQMEQNAQRFQPQYLGEANAPVRAGIQEAAEVARVKLNTTHAEALTAVDAWAQMSGEKINAEDMALLHGDFPLTAADFRRLILKYENNYTMLSAIVAEAETRHMRFQLGYTPSPEDKRIVYDKFYASALSLLDSIYMGGGVSDSMIAGYADPARVTDPRFIAVLSGLAAVQGEPSRPETSPDTNTEFGFAFRRAAPNPTRW